MKMDIIVDIILISYIISYCNGVSFREQLEHIAKRRQESRGGFDMKHSRRFNNSPGQMSVILGSPSMASHLPEAEAILPGHTLIRPALGMLKSAVKFPHRALDNGAGVYGNIENLGLRYDGKSERVLYSGFRRMPEHYIMNEKRSQPKYSDSKKNINTLTNNPLFIKINPPRSTNKRIKKNTVLYGSKLSRNPKGTLPLSKPKSLNNRLMDKRKRHRKPTVGPAYAYINLEDLGLLRSGKGTHGEKSIQKMAYNIEEIASDSTDDEEIEGGNEDNDDNAELEQESGNTNEGKKIWFWKTKDAYNHIKIDPGAPEHEELMPSHATPKIREWWFYHQGDFEPLDIV